MSTDRPNLVEGMLQKKNQSEEVQPLQVDNIPDFKNIREASEMMGAFKAFELNATFSRIMQGRLLEEMKKDKQYKSLGYPNFDEFCQQELHISSRQANIIFDERKKLGTVVENLIKIGLKPKDLKVITQLKEDDEIEVNSEMIKFDDGMEFEIKPDNLMIIQEVINKYKEEKAKQKKALDELAKSHLENSNKIKELEAQLNAPIPIEIGEFEKSLEPYKTQFLALYTKLEKLKKQVENDPGRLLLVKGLIAYFDEIGTAKGSAILGEEVI